MKVSIIMPTYNDGNYISETFDSIFNQSYKNWELIVVNDGSTDNTEETVKSLKDERVKYIYQENADQLNALLNASQYITGDLVYLLHSDDLFNSNEVIEKVVELFKKNKEIDGVYSDLTIIDENSNVKGIMKTNYKYSFSKEIAANLYLNYGMQLINDFFFVKKEIFNRVIIESYLKWNRPYWLDYNNLNPVVLKKTDFFIRDYRVFSGNYFNSELGKLNVINGNLRTLVTLMGKIDIPFFDFQRFTFKVFTKLKLADYFKAFYLKKPTRKEKRNKILKKAIHARLGEIPDNEYIKSLLAYYSNNNNRSIKIREKIKEEDVYYGKDMRAFNKKISDGTISPFYKGMFFEMSQGFEKIIVGNKEELEKLKVILTFLNIDCEITVEDY